MVVEEVVVSHRHHLLVCRTCSDYSYRKEPKRSILRLVLQVYKQFCGRLSLFSLVKDSPQSWHL